MRMRKISSGNEKEIRWHRHRDPLPQGWRYLNERPSHHTHYARMIERDVAEEGGNKEVEDNDPQAILVAGILCAVFVGALIMGLFANVWLALSGAVAGFMLGATWYVRSNKDKS